MYHQQVFFYFFFFNDTATTEIYTLSLHDALPISYRLPKKVPERPPKKVLVQPSLDPAIVSAYRRIKGRSEEHTSELQSRLHLVCRLLLEKKKKKADKAWTS